MRAALLALLCLTTPAVAQQQACAPSGTIERNLMTQAGETIMDIGRVPGGVLFTMANPATGSFTVLLRSPDGKTCILIAGTGWEQFRAVREGLPL